MSRRSEVQVSAPVAGAGMPVNLRQRVGALWQRLREGGALMVGVPDYARYVAHMQETHPELAPLSREAFVRARMEARYGGKGGGKCPC
ncbi:MAG: putative small protein [Moraxellaceae bacterium]|jgi:uncharacterized short protein YbdD (DUF466 family)|nr:putative small protein [Moraxellaceae bacterium]